jgi:hypothetical protein
MPGGARGRPAHAFPGAAGCLTAGRARNAPADLTLPQQLRQLGDVGGDAAGFVAGHEIGRLGTPRVESGLHKVWKQI